MKERTKKLTSLDDLFRTDEERAADSAERVTTLPMDRLRYFKEHPFQVRDDEEMQSLVESVEQFGVLSPILVRPVEDGMYEIVSGHRRHRASELANVTEIPAIVRDLSDDEAIILMVDANLQREKLLPSEKALAYKMKLDAMNRQGKRTDLTYSQVGNKLTNKTSSEVLAEQTGESKNQIFRYVRLTHLNPELLDMTDKGKLAFNSAVELSYLKPEEQAAVFTAMERDEAAPSLKQARELKKHSKEGELTEKAIDTVMSAEKPIESKVVLQGDTLRKYFPSTYTPRQMEQQILKLLDIWLRQKSQPER
ncbi:MAG: ParB/RepB/Spo0J family partition protein [Clostridiaceae bacterium]|nr:ParB/RepB/Spo0J family partition protein [Clostridiaceae bacterium]RKJ77783.1 ParB/RepB/Spo0J family partition protein [Butyricicoccus sp. 1XD8-22]